MPLSYKARRIGSVLVLVVVLPIYIMLVLGLVPRLEIESKILELIVFVFFGVVWVLPFRRVFLGVGRADPDAQADDGSRGKDDSGR